MRFKTSYVFILAGLYNLAGILVPNRFFTDQSMASIDPVVFSWLGQVGIILWGLAYLSVSRRFFKAPQLVAVFAIEKAVYVVAWLTWLTQHQLSEAGNLQAFFAIYGLGDLIFGILFALVAIKTARGHYQD